jgi:hypothetical protein
VSDGQRPYSRGFSPWVLYDVAAPDPDFTGFVGLNIPGAEPNGEVNWHDVAYLLAPPSATSVTVDDADIYRVHDGRAVIDAGERRTPVTVNVRGVPDSGGYRRAVGVPGSAGSQVPQLAQVAPLSVSQSLRSLGESSGQGDSMFLDETRRRPGPTTVYARCFGAGPIRVAVDTDREGAGVSIPCDDRQHAVSGADLRTPNSLDNSGHGYVIHASDYTAWRVAVFVNR